MPKFTALIHRIRIQNLNLSELKVCVVRCWWFRPEPVCKWQGKKIPVVRRMLTLCSKERRIDGAKSQGRILDHIKK